MRLIFLLVAVPWLFFCTFFATIQVLESPPWIQIPVLVIAVAMGLVPLLLAWKQPLQEDSAPARVIKKVFFTTLGIFAVVLLLLFLLTWLVASMGITR